MSKSSKYLDDFCQNKYDNIIIACPRLAMNKITIEPFGSNSNIPVRDVTATPRLINRFKKNSTFADRFKVNKKPWQDQ